MTDNLDVTLHNESLTANPIRVQNSSIIAKSDCTARDLRVTHESDKESEKPIFLELGVTSNNQRTTTDLSLLPYTSNYPLEVPLSSVYIPGIPIHQYSTNHTLLYNNPYHSGISTTLSQFSLYNSSQSATDSTAILSLNNIPYSSHIPQTVYTWSSPAPVTSVSPNLDHKLSAEVVPPPVYMSYSDGRKHKINKLTNPLWKEKALQTEKDYKKTACDRERTRMRDMNRAFDLLRSKLPISKPNGKKYSKIESLRIAINYINHLQKSLNDNTTDQMNLETANYFYEFNMRRRTSLNRYNNQKICPLEETNDKCKDLDESRSTWSDGYISNGKTTAASLSTSHTFMDPSEAVIDNKSLVMPTEIGGAENSNSLATEC